MPSTPHIWTPDHERQLILQACKAAAATVLGDVDGKGPEPLTEYVNDPNGYWVDVLQERPWKGSDGVPGQYELNQMLVDEPFICLFAGTGPGKTYWLSRALHWFLMTRRNALAFLVAPTWQQVINQGFRHLRAVHAKAKRNANVPGRCLQAMLDVDDRWFCQGMSPKDPENLAGYHADQDPSDAAIAEREQWLQMTNEEFFKLALQGQDGDAAVILAYDETSNVRDEFHDAGEGLLTGPGSRCIKSGNLTRTSGRYHKHWQDYTPATPNRVCYDDEESKKDRKARLAKAKRQAAGKAPTQSRPDGEEKVEGPAWRTIRWTAFDAPEAIVKRSWVERMRKECGPNYEKNPRYMVRVLALPPEGSELAVYPLALLEDCADIRPKSGGRHMGVDLGYGGGDPCVAQLWVNGRLSSTFRWQVEGPVLDLVDSAKVIATLARGDPTVKGDKGWGVKASHVHVDASDSGDMGVCDLLARFHQMVVDRVNFGGAVVGDWNYILGRPPGKLLNRKQELGWIALRCLQDGRMGIPAQEEFGPVIAQMSAVHYHEVGAENFRMEKKIKYIARTGRSSDDFDPVLLALSRVDPGRLRVRTVRQRRRRGR